MVGAYQNSLCVFLRTSSISFFRIENNLVALLRIRQARPSLQRKPLLRTAGFFCKGIGDACERTACDTRNKHDYESPTLYNIKERTDLSYTVSYYTIFSIFVKYLCGKRLKRASSTKEAAPAGYPRNNDQRV